MMDWFPLTQLPRELRASRLMGDGVPGYRRCYNLVLDDRLPGVELVDGRYRVRRSALPEIAAALRGEPTTAIAA